MGKSRTRARVGKSVACRRDRRGRMPSLHEAGHGLTKHLGDGVVLLRGYLCGRCAPWRTCTAAHPTVTADCTFYRSLRGENAASLTDGRAININIKPLTIKQKCARACSDVNAYMAAASHSQRAGFPRPQTQTSICGGGYRRGFRVPAAKRCITCPGNDFPGYSPCVVSRRPLHLHRANALNALFTALMCINRSKNDYRCAQGGIAPLLQATACLHPLLAPRELSKTLNFSMSV